MENRIENKRKKVVFVLTACWAVFVCVCAPAFAQDVPTSVDPSRRTESLERQAAPEMESLRLPAATPAFDANIPEGAEAYSFVLTDLQVRGVSVYRPEKIQRLYQDKIGQSISVADIYTIAGKITQRYRDDGFLLAQAVIPPQEIDQGVVIIEVNEGTIARVAYEGFEDGKIPFFARGIAQRIEQISPFNVHFLERQLLLLNRATGYQAVGILEPLPAEEAAPGAVGLKILMADAASAYSASMDNYGSNYVGPWQVGGQARIGHTGMVNGVTDMSLFTSPQVKEIGYASLGETTLLSSDGLSLNAAVKYSRSEPGGSLRELDLKSRFLSVAMELEYPVFLSRSYELNLFGGFELKNSKSDILGTRFYDDRLRIVHAGIRGQNSDVFGGFLFGTIELSQGLDILGARETGSIDLSRAQGRSDFTKIEMRATHLARLAENISLKNSVFGQYAFAPLMSSEEFGYGGYELGRGYNNSEITGDSGIGFSTELSYQRWGAYEGNFFAPGFVPFVFYDVGKVWNRDDATPPLSGASAGLGTVINWGPGIEARFTLAQPLTRQIENQTYGNGKNPRYLVSFQYNF